VGAHTFNLSAMDKIVKFSYVICVGLAYGRRRDGAVRISTLGDMDGESSKCQKQ